MVENSNDYPYRLNSGENLFRNIHMRTNEGILIQFTLVFNMYNIHPYQHCSDFQQNVLHSE